MRYELWHSESGGCHTFFPDDQNPGDPPEDARLDWSVEADTWESAQAAKHDHLGWEPYRPTTESTSTHPSP